MAQVSCSTPLSRLLDSLTRLSDVEFIWMRNAHSGLYGYKFMSYDETSFFENNFYLKSIHSELWKFSHFLHNDQYIKTNVILYLVHNNVWILEHGCDTGNEYYHQKKWFQCNSGINPKTSMRIGTHTIMNINLKVTNLNACNRVLHYVGLCCIISHFVA